MPSFLQVENISKSYGPKVLFDRISFNVNEGDKIALVAPNGTGKTSLLRILAGNDRSDSGGSVKFLCNIRTAFLEQEYSFDPEASIEEQLAIPLEDTDRRLSAARILDELGLQPSLKMKELSGGGVKRVAITDLLSRGAEFLIMDEPTNHLDLDGIEYLENSLKKSRCTLFMVTHDRYFLDRVCNTVMEMDRGSLYIYKGDYENFLVKRDERISNYNAVTDKARNILRRELEWIHATPCARSGKAKYRKQAFWDIKERAEAAYVQTSVRMDALGTGSRLGSKVIDCKDLCFSYGDTPIVSHFTYNFQRFDRVGIVGGNGVGKTTFLDLLVSSDMKSIERGESLRIGYYRQDGMSFDEDDTVLDIVSDTRLLGRFLFPREMYTAKVARLSGGERRRLYLLTVLMQEPNLLILDEPTNDLDIVTLNVLEEYLLDFKGSLIIVTHDRHFLDRLVGHLLVFTGGGNIKDFIGGYSEYRSFISDLRAEKKRQEREKASAAAAKAAVSSKGTATASSQSGENSSSQPVGEAARADGAAPAPRKLSFKEKREMEELEARTAALEAEKAEIERRLSEGGGSYEEITRESARYQALKDELDAAEMRLLELMCIQTG